MNQLQGVAVAEMVIEKAKRLVEHKKDVVILFFSITRLIQPTMHSYLVLVKF